MRGRLEPETGALFLRALAAARETLYRQARSKQEAGLSADPAQDQAPITAPTSQAPPMATASIDQQTGAQQQADALALLAETALHHGLDDPGG